MDIDAQRHDDSHIPITNYRGQIIIETSETRLVFFTVDSELVDYSSNEKTKNFNKSVFRERNCRTTVSGRSKKRIAIPGLREIITILL